VQRRRPLRGSPSDHHGGKGNNDDVINDSQIFFTTAPPGAAGHVPRVHTAHGVLPPAPTPNAAALSRVGPLHRHHLALPLHDRKFRGPDGAAPIPPGILPGTNAERADPSRRLRRRRRTHAADVCKPRAQ